MATRIEEILGRDINSLKELREEIKRLQDSIANVDPTTQEFVDTSQKLIAAQEQLTSVTRASKDANVAAEDSIVGMERAYKALYNEYKMLTEEQRNSDFGKNMAESLNTLSNKLNDTKKGVGNFKDNIGRYTQSTIDAFNQMGISIGGLQGPMKLAAGGAKTLGASLKALIANPVGAVIMAIVVAFKAMSAIVERVKKAIDDNEESSNRLKEAMATFKPVVDAISNAFDFLAKIAVKVAEGLSKVGEKVLSIIPGFKEAAKSHKELAKATSELTKRQRELNIENSEKEAEIERLREEASETDNVAEKKKLLEEAKAKQAEVDQSNVAIAQEELRIMQEYAAKTANSAEENDKLAEAQRKVNEAIAQGEKNQRLYNKQLAATTTSTKSAGGAAKNYREEAKKIYEETVENSKSEVQKVTEKYEKEKKLLEKYHYDTTLLTKQYEKDMQDIMNKAAEEQAKKRSEMRKREKEDRENEWTSMGADVANEMEMETTKTALGKLNSVKAFVDGLIHQYADALGENEEKANQLMGILQKLDEEGFQALEKDFPNLTDAINELNDKFGITITTSHSLDNAIASTKKRVQELNDEAAQIRLDEKFKNSQNALTSELLSALEGSESNFSVVAANAAYENLQAQKSALEEELTDTQITYDKKMEILEQYYDVSAQLRQADWDAERLDAERTQNLWNDAFSTYDSLSQSIQTVTNSVGALIQAQLNDGKITKQEAEKKKKTLIALEKVALAVNIAQIAASTAAGIMDVWKSYGAELALNAETAAATGPAAAATKAALDAKSLASAIIRTAALGTAGAANIAAATMGTISKVQSLKDDGGGGGGAAGVTANVAEIDSTPYTYTRTLQTSEEEDVIYNKDIWVSVSDIESGLNHKVKVTDESSF